MIDDPAVRDVRTVRQLSGMSGARVLLLSRDDRHWFVRKVARAPETNARLRGQLAKQLAFSDAMSDVARTPRVLDQGEIEGRFYFDMEFVRGVDGVSYLRRASYADVIAFGDRLCAYVDAIATRAPARRSSGTLFDALYAKICEVQRATSAIPSDTLVRLFMALDRMRRLPEPSPTMCHGDLTLENIIVDDHGALWMLDLLDAPYEHWWQDIAKLHQDLDGGWYLLRQAQVARCVVAYLSRRLLDAAVRIDPHYADVHDLLLACTFARILPYVFTDGERRFVAERVEHFCQLLGATP